MSQFPVWNKIFFTYSQCPVFYSQKVSHFGFCMNEFLECLVNLVYWFLSYASFLPISFVTRHKLYNSSLKWAVHGNYTAPSGVPGGIHKSCTRPLITAACSDCHRQIPGPEWLWSTCQQENIFFTISLILLLFKTLSTWTSSCFPRPAQLQEALPAPQCRSVPADKGLWKVLSPCRKKPSQCASAN